MARRTSKPDRFPSKVLTEAAEPKPETEAAPPVKEEPEEAPRGVGGQYVSIGGGRRRKA